MRALCLRFLLVSVVALGFLVGNPLGSRANAASLSTCPTTPESAYTTLGGIRENWSKTEFGSSLTYDGVIPGLIVPDRGYVTFVGWTNVFLPGEEVKGIGGFFLDCIPATPAPSGNIPVNSPQACTVDTQQAALSYGGDSGGWYRPNNPTHSQLLNYKSTDAVAFVVPDRSRVISDNVWYLPGDVVESSDLEVTCYNPLPYGGTTVYLPLIRRAGLIQ